jgi:UDP-N-acetylmuramate--alanine ligase
MSALARFFHSKQKKVSGMIPCRNRIDKRIGRLGIPVHYEENLELIPKDVELWSIRPL